MVAGTASLIRWSIFATVAAALWIVVNARAQPQPPGQPLACGGGVTVLLEGKPLSAGCVLNLKAASGVIATATPNPGIGGTDIGFTFNTALIATLDQEHHNPNFCNSANGATQYTCKLPNKALSAYQLGDTFELLTDAACASTCQVNIDTAGLLNIWSRDGSTAAAFPAGIPVWIWYDGKKMRLL